METNLIAQAVAAANAKYDIGGNMRLRIVDIINALEGAQLTLEDAGDILTVVARKVDADYNVEPYPERFAEDVANLAAEIQDCADCLYKMQPPATPEDIADAEIDREPYDWNDAKG